MFVWVVTKGHSCSEYIEPVEQYIGVYATLDDAKEAVRGRESYKGVVIEWTVMGTDFYPGVTDPAVWYGAGPGVSTGLYTARRCEVVAS